MRHTILLLMIAATLALPACNKDAKDAGTPANDSPEAPSGMLGEAANKAKAEQAAAALPQPDTSKPLASYTELDSGNQIMFLYVAASKLPPDYEKLAQSYSREYRESNDSFRKNDLLQAIKPQLDQKIAMAKADPYGWMQIDDARLGAYDFDRKGFPVGEFEEGRYRYFNDAYDYNIGWSNYAQMGFLPVADEATARQIESIRAKYGSQPRLKVYFFAQTADLDNQRVNALVTRTQLVDRSGRVLAEYGPDGSVAPAPTPTANESTAPMSAHDIAADVLGG